MLSYQRTVPSKTHFPAANPGHSGNVACSTAYRKPAYYGPTRACGSQPDPCTPQAVGLEWTTAARGAFLMQATALLTPVLESLGGGRLSRMQVPTFNPHQYSAPSLS